MSQPVETGTENAPATEGTENKGTGSAEPQNEMSVEDLRKELSKVRAEAASRRVALKEQEAAAQKWKEYEESQKSELQKLQDQLAEKDKAIAAKELEVTRARIAKQYNVADDDLDLLVGDEDNMKRLAERLGQKSEPQNNRPTDLLAGNRGKPVGNNGNTFSMEDFIRGSVK